MMGYNEVGIFLPNVADESTKTIATTIVVIHEFNSILQQQVSGSGQHWKLTKHYYSCKKSWEHTIQHWDFGTTTTSKNLKALVCY